MKKLFNQITWQLCRSNSSWWVFSCSIAAGFWIKRYLKNTSASWLLWLLLLQVNSLSLSSIFWDFVKIFWLFFTEHIFDNNFFKFCMPNIFIESLNHPQKQPTRLLFFKKATRQIFQKIYSEEVLLPNLIEVKLMEVLEILSFYTDVLL